MDVKDDEMMNSPTKVQSITDNCLIKLQFTLLYVICGLSIQISSIQVTFVS